MNHNNNNVDERQQTRTGNESNLVSTDNSNVIYDNDTTLNVHTTPATNSFVDSANVYDAIDELQTKDQFATCSLEQQRPTSVEDLVGRLDFWQPIENRGILHLVARIVYSLPTANSQAHNETRRKRESFQILIERRAPSDLDGDFQFENTKSQREEKQPIQLRHELFLADDCEPNNRRAGDNQTAASGGLFGEIKSTKISASGARRTVDIDAELVVGQFNLTGTNGIENKCLQLKLLHEDRGTELIGKCQVKVGATAPQQMENQNNNNAETKLDFASSVSVVQPVREELLKPTENYTKKTEKHNKLSAN